MSPKRCLSFLCVLLLLFIFGETFAQPANARNDVHAKRVFFGTGKLAMVLDYNRKATLSQVTVNGQDVLSNQTGIISKIRTREAVYSTAQLSSTPFVKVSGNTLTVEGIRYGDKNIEIAESWIFTLRDNDIQWDVARTLSKAITAEEVAFPAITFNSIHTWEGAYQDYGGLAWFYLFNQRRETYGVHSTSSEFWNSKTGNGLTVQVAAPGGQVAMDYSRTMADHLAFRVAVSPAEPLPRFDAGTNRRQFVRDTTDVWAPITLPAGKSSETITFSPFNFTEKFGRGKFKGINQEQVSAVLNTIARIGVIDKNHFGGNSWHTPYGPICLHEQYIAQMGLAINDTHYLMGYEQCLDFYRDHAIREDGRVWPRWAYNNVDAMPNVFTNKGFYEAQWGYLLDSNPDLVTNVAELYDLTGNLEWVKTHQRSCEKALDWILARDSNDNGLVEMMTDSHHQKRGSDWIDIIWASYENAFLNAKVYHALVLWADIERQLGDSGRASHYKEVAQKLKDSFNKPTSAGGFWDEEKKCYIHWRDKDGSVHGNNMVTPVNFMAIAYGLCEDEKRSNTILDNIEVQMEKEKLFFWPICLFTYASGEGNDWQFPFPNYENGDIFLSWGAVGVKAYAAYKPELAIKYVRNVLAQYTKDGLAFQRYGRAKQDGLGDDILSGNALSVVGLYQAIYGINPLYNRLYLNPRITDALAGTQVKYTYRDQHLKIDLDSKLYSISNGRFRIISKTDFGFFSHTNDLAYYHRNANRISLQVKCGSPSTLTLTINQWTPDEISFTQSGEDATDLKYQINDLKPNDYYTIVVNNKTTLRIQSNRDGSLLFENRAKKEPEEIRITYR